MAAKRWFVWKNLKTSGRPQVYYIQGETLDEAWAKYGPSGPIGQSYSVVEAQHVFPYKKVTRVVIQRQGENK